MTSHPLSFPFATQQLRVVMRDGEPWFVAADVCGALDVRDTSMAVARLDEDERGTSTVGTPSGEQQMLVINESGLYSLTLTSRKPEAKRFKKWVTSEVLPSIRKTGRYQVQSQPAAPQAAPLSAADMGRLSRVVDMMRPVILQTEAWSQAVHCALRQATGRKAPARYTVDDLPALADELQRIVPIVDGFGDAVRRAEMTVIRRLLRKREDAAELMATIEADLAQAARLKSSALRAAYSEAFDAWAAGEGDAALTRRLDVAWREKNRFMAERIAQTELARAHQAQRAQELMADDSIDVVQVMLNPRHPVADICDLHGRANLWGLGPGCYPKARAPRPPFHPFCWCVLRSRPDLEAADARRAAGGEGAFLRGLPDGEAARVMGSRARAAEVMGGASVESVINRGKNELYKLARLGGGGGHALVKPESPSMKTPYEIAKAGGDGAKFLKQLPKLGRKQLEKSAESLEKRALEHEEKIRSPLSFVPDWHERAPEYREGLVAKWGVEVQNFRQQAAIIKGYINEHGI